MVELELELADGKITIEIDESHVIQSQLMVMIKGKLRKHAISIINLFGGKVITIW